MGMECASCGAKNRDGARFCRSCGSRLEPASAATDANAPTPEEWPITEPTPQLESPLTGSAAANEKTVAISPSPAPQPPVRHPAPVPAPSAVHVPTPKAASRPAELVAPAAPRRSTARWGVVALLLVVLAAGSWFVQSRRDASTPALSPIAATAGAVTVPPPVPVPDPAPAAPEPEPTVPPPAVQDTAAEVPAQTAPPTAIAESPAPPVTPVPSVPPVQPPPRVKAKAPARPAAVAAAPNPRKPAPAVPAPAAPPAPPPAVIAMAPAPIEPIAPPNPGVACAGQGFFGRARCMVAQCAKAEYRTHTQCDAVRRQQQIDEEKRNPSLAN
ncbi:hypothetical protein H6CHR_05621 [Variovorax sp. PBL-H6]|nr:hypothetical protein H6CHR_05621 [Variovorax sp. PBL-H6]